MTRPKCVVSPDLIQCENVEALKSLSVGCKEEGKYIFPSGISNTCATFASR